MNYPSEEGKVGNVVDEIFLASCIDCGSKTNITMHAHRNGHGDMIGFIFLCDKCSHKAETITMRISGIRSAPATEQPVVADADWFCPVCKAPSICTAMFDDGCQAYTCKNGHNWENPTDRFKMILKVLYWCFYNPHR